MKTLADILRRNAALYPEHLAVADATVRRSHRELLARGLGIARGLTGAGVQRQQTVAVLSRNRTEYLEIYAACELGSFIAVGLNWRLAVPELVSILDDCAARVLFYEAHFATAAQELRARLPQSVLLVCIDGPGQEFDRLAGTPGPDDDLGPSPDDLVYLVYTSGTTGKPKGVMLDHAGQLSSALSMALDTGAQLDDSLLAVMPLFHIGARCKALAYTFRGAAVVVQSQFNAAGVLDAIQNESVTALHLAPTMIQAVLEEQDVRPRSLGSIRAVHYAAAPMPLPLLEKALQRFGTVFTQFYGLTESGPVGTVLHRSQHLPLGTAQQRRRLASAGQPSPTCRVRIVAGDGTDCEQGQVGEVLLSSPALMRGYWNNPEATRDAMPGGWLRTGDVGFLDEECFLFLVDRMKDMVVTGGENVYPREVENALLLHDGVSAVAVVGIPDPKWGEAILAFVVPRPGAELGEQQLIDHTKSLIASYKKPRGVRFVDSLPLLPTGKVDKKALRAPFWTSEARAI